MPQCGCAATAVAEARGGVAPVESGAEELGGVVATALDVEVDSGGVGRGADLVGPGFGQISLLAGRSRCPASVRIGRTWEEVATAARPSRRALRGPGGGTV